MTRIKLLTQSLVRNEDGTLLMELGLLIAALTAACIATLMTPIMAFPWH